MTRYIKSVYNKVHPVANIKTGEIVDGKEKVGETFTGDANLYGSIYAVCTKALYMFDPIHCSSLFIYLMGETELGTNRVNINCKDLMKAMSCGKDTIYRCLNVLKKSYTLLEHEGYWVINPILFFRGNKTQRYELYVKLGRPGFYVSPEMLRKEFHNEEKLML